MITPKSCWISALLLLVGVAGAAEAVPGASDVCRDGRPVQGLAVYYRKKLVRPRPGTPLDEALGQEQRQVEAIREEARNYFLRHSYKPLDSLKERYTFLLESGKEEGIGVEAAGISSALKYRSSLWRQYIERFTNVEEATSDDPYQIRFAVRLDLGAFCRLRQRVDDLVTR